MPTSDSIDHRFRVRIAGHVRARMNELGWNQAKVAREAAVDKSFLSKLLKAPDTAPLGLDNFIRLVHGLRLNAHQVLFAPPPKASRMPPTFGPDNQAGG